jgi:hypothetical protein
MMKSIKVDLKDKTESVLSELNECFKIVSATLVPSDRGVYITDNKVQCCLTIESFFPKEIICNRAAISIEPCTEDKQEKKTPVKGYKTDLNVNGSVSTQTNVQRKTSDVSADSDVTNYLSR